MKKTLLLLIVLSMLFTFAACGNETPKAEKYCWSCGGGVTKQAVFCEHCGVSLKETSTEASSNDGPTGTTQIPTDEVTGTESTQPSTDESIGTGTTQPSACNHSWKEATCTTPKTCEKCNLTEGEANGHWWHEATCTDARICTVCLAEDPDSEPLGHSYVQGECERCGETDPGYSQVAITADKYSLYLNSDSSVVYITMTGGDSVTYDIGNTNIVNCEWGDWDGDTIPLTFHPISSGQTSVTIYIEGTDVEISIDVTVDRPIPYSLTIVGIGEEFETATGAYQNISIINSADYSVTDNIDYNNTVSFEVDVVATMIQAGDPPAFGALYTIGIDYELINEDGVYVQTGNLWIDVDYLNRAYAQTIYFFDLEPGHYTLKFSDNYY